MQTVRAELLELPLVGLLERLLFEELRQMAQTAQAGPARTAPVALPEPVGTAQAVSRMVRRARVRRVLIACPLAAASAVSGVGIYLSAQAPQPAAVRRCSRSLPSTRPHR